MEIGCIHVLLKFTLGVFLSISEAMNIKHQIRQSGFEGPAKRGQDGPSRNPIIARICTVTSCWTNQTPQDSVTVHLPPTSITAKSQTHDSPVSNDCNGKFFVFLSTAWTPMMFAPLHRSLEYWPHGDRRDVYLQAARSHEQIMVFEGQLWDSRKICLNMFRSNLNSFINETLRRCCKGVKHYATLSLALGLVWELGCQFWYALRLDVARYNY